MKTVVERASRDVAGSNNDETQLEDRIVNRVIDALEKRGLLAGVGATQGRTPRVRKGAKRKLPRRESSPSSGGPRDEAPLRGISTRGRQRGAGQVDSEDGARSIPREDWATVVRRPAGRGRVRLAGQTANVAPGGYSAGERGATGVRPDTRRVVQRPASAKRQRAPRTAAVSILGDKEKEGCSYGEILSKARKSIALSELGIDQICIRFGATGGMLIKIHGSDNKTKADQLAVRLRAVIPEGARVSRPMKMAEIKIIGLNDRQRGRGSGSPGGGKVSVLT